MQSRCRRCVSRNLHLSSHALCPPCTYTQIRITCQVLGARLWDLESSFTSPLPQQRDLLYYSIYVLYSCAPSDMNALPLEMLVLQKENCSTVYMLTKELLTTGCLQRKVPLWGHCHFFVAKESAIVGSLSFLCRKGRCHCGVIVIPLSQRKVPLPLAFIDLW